MIATGRRVLFTAPHSMLRRYRPVFSSVVPRILSECDVLGYRLRRLEQLHHQVDGGQEERDLQIIVLRGVVVGEELHRIVRVHVDVLHLVVVARAQRFLDGFPQLGGGVGDVLGQRRRFARRRQHRRGARIATRGVPPLGHLRRPARDEVQSQRRRHLHVKRAAAVSPPEPPNDGGGVELAHAHLRHRRPRVVDVILDVRVVGEALSAFELSFAVVVLHVHREGVHGALVLSDGADVRRDLPQRALHRRGRFTHEIVADLVQRDQSRDGGLLRVE
mmetsp:Transcript_12870/g.55259  ORF Transcript_12870/g.55259 Transcript_12870/m.55259 type:complete len:275 (+) Transcript_12870:1553-2377(+)